MDDIGAAAKFLTKIGPTPITDYDHLRYDDNPEYADDPPGNFERFDPAKGRAPGDGESEESTVAIAILEKWLWNELDITVVVKEDVDSYFVVVGEKPNCKIYFGKTVLQALISVYEQLKGD